MATKKITFSLTAPEAKAVSLAADFTGWDSTPIALRKSKGGVWKTSIELAPGRYEYRYVVDGQWTDDPGCCERAANPYGGENCVRVVA